MNLIIPEFGLVIWMTITFSILLFILGKFAWKPILRAIREREDSIESALKAAVEAKEQMAKMQSDNEALLKEARVEREQILKEARQMKDQIIAQAKNTAQEEGAKLIDRANQEINKNKQAAIDELKAQVAALSIEIAEKLVSQKLENSGEQDKLIAEHMNQIANSKSASLN